MGSTVPVPKPLNPATDGDLDRAGHVHVSPTPPANPPDTSSNRTDSSTDSSREPKPSSIPTPVIPVIRVHSPLSFRELGHIATTGAPLSPLSPYSPLLSSIPPLSPTPGWDSDPADPTPGSDPKPPGAPPSTSTPPDTASQPAVSTTPAAPTDKPEPPSSPAPSTPPSRFFSRGPDFRVVTRDVEFQVVGYHLRQSSHCFAERIRNMETPRLELDCDPHDFSAFLEVLHFGPIITAEFVALKADDDKVTTLLAAAAIAFKYEDFTLGSWALEHVLPALESNMALITPAIAERLVRLVVSWPPAASLPNADRRRVQNTIVNALMNDSNLLSTSDIIERVLLPTCSVKPADVDTLILSHTYYELLRRLGRSAWTADNRLDMAHRQRLVCGYASLVDSWSWYLRRAEKEAVEFAIDLRKRLDDRLSGEQQCALLQRVQILAEVADELKLESVAAKLVGVVETEHHMLWEHFDTSRWGL